MLTLAMNKCARPDWTLLIVDGQNDFRDIRGAALPIPGATADLRRLARLIHLHQARIHAVVATLDSQPQVAIERVSFWKRGDGRPVAPFTQVSLEQVDSGELLPRNPALLPTVRQYLRALDARGRKHTIWPVHGVIGTWGHALCPSLARAIGAWEEHTQRQALKILKGLNPLTEQFSAVRAEVPRADDPSTQTNHELIEAVRPHRGYLLIGGEAASHCVADTARDLTADFASEQMQRVILLTDCMSTIPGCEAATERFFSEMSHRGARLMKSTEVAQLPVAESLS
jgi:nicotinamidase/pyrazinamidase